MDKYAENFVIEITRQIKLDGFEIEYERGDPIVHLIVKTLIIAHQIYYQ